MSNLNSWIDAYAEHLGCAATPMAVESAIESLIAHRDRLVAHFGPTVSATGPDMRHDGIRMRCFDLTIPVEAEDPISAMELMTVAVSAIDKSVGPITLANVDEIKAARFGSPYVEVKKAEEQGQDPE